MAFTGNYSCNTLRTGLINGSINFSTNVFYLALYTNSATLDQTTAAYTTSGEASGGNYAAGGQQITASVGTQTTSFGSIIFINFSVPQWAGAITARGALIYRNSDGLAISVIDFGSNKTSTSTFAVQMPANTYSSALIRLA
jgi:hypothetical protein